MKTLSVLLLGFCLSAYSHDGGHGPKLKDFGKKGGRVTSVVMTKEAGKGSSAKSVYNSEIVRSKDGKVKIYFYDKDMNALKLDSFAKKAKASLISGRGGKETVKDFELNLITDHFEGMTPKPIPRRYTIEVKVSEGDKELLAAFDNLD